jgi:hypothetical protein
MRDRDQVPWAPHSAVQNHAAGRPFAPNRGDFRRLARRDLGDLDLDPKLDLARRGIQLPRGPGLYGLPARPMARDSLRPTVLRDADRPPFIQRPSSPSGARRARISGPILL